MKPLYILLLTVIAFNAQAQNKVVPYEFPVKPGTPEWKFSSPEMMYATCQVPKDVLSSINSEALVITCINYPLFGLMNAFNSPQVGFEEVTRRFNGLAELLQRKDAGSALLKVYKTMDPALLQKSWPLLQQGQYIEKFRFIEMILAQTAVLESLDNIGQAELLRLVRLKYSAKNNVLDVFGILGLQSSLLPAAKLLDIKGTLHVKNEAITRYLQSGQPISQADTDAIYARILR